MQIPFTEPTAPRYIYINPVNNQVHLLLPVVSGTSIGLDNTCKAVYSVQEFFGKNSDSKTVSALTELKNYKSALEFDLGLIHEETEVKQAKEQRLQQINHYIKALDALTTKKELDTLSNNFPSYPQPLTELMHEKQSNLYSIQLRPEVQDVNLRTVHPVFSINRRNDESGKPDSHVYNALHDTFKHLTVKPRDAKSRLIQVVLASEEAKRNDFAGIQAVLIEQTNAMLDQDVDFKLASGGAIVTQDFIDESMGFTRTTTKPEEYIEALLGYCAPGLFDNVVEESPFYTIAEPTSETAKNAAIERFSILTQFFMAQVNVYCTSHGLSAVNFGDMLDKSQDLCNEMAARILSVHASGLSIEETLLDFVNDHQVDFQLDQALTEEDRNTIKTRFTEHYAEIKDSPHFDEFMMLDKHYSGLFVTHQNSIAVDFTEFAKSDALNIDSQYFQTVRDGFRYINQTSIIPHQNRHIAANIDIKFEELNETQIEDLLKKLPIKTRLQILKTMPELQLRIQ